LEHQKHIFSTYHNESMGFLRDSASEYTCGGANEDRRRSGGEVFLHPKFMISRVLKSSVILFIIYRFLTCICIVCNCQRWKMSTQPVFVGWWEMFLKSPRHSEKHLDLRNHRWDDYAYRNHPATPTRTMETDAPVMDVNCRRKRQPKRNLKGWAWAKGQQSKYRSSGSWNSQVGQ